MHSLVASAVVDMKNREVPTSYMKVSSEHLRMHLKILIGFSHALACCNHILVCEIIKSLLFLCSLRGTFFSIIPTPNQFCTLDLKYVFTFCTYFGFFWI